MTTENDYDWDAVDDLQFSLDVLMVNKYLGKPSIPKSKGSPSIQQLHAWATNPENTGDFYKNMLPKAQDRVRNARLKHKTEEEELHERKAVVKLKEILQEELDKVEK